LERLPGVKRAEVKLETGQARVIYDDTTQTPERLAAALDKLGFRASLVGVTELPEGAASTRR
jgi:copper chaperone CopZ